MVRPGRRTAKDSRRGCEMSAAGGRNISCRAKSVAPPPDARKRLAKPKMAQGGPRRPCGRLGFHKPFWPISTQDGPRRPSWSTPPTALCTGSDKPAVKVGNVVSQVRPTSCERLRVRAGRPDAFPASRPAGPDNIGSRPGALSAQPLTRDADGVRLASGGSGVTPTEHRC